MYYNSMSSEEYGTDQYGPYASEALARDGFFRLVVSATTADDDVVRLVASGYGDRETITTEDRETTEWTPEYKHHVYTDDDFCRRQRLLWEQATGRR